MKSVHPNNSRPNESNRSFDLMTPLERRVLMAADLVISSITMDKQFLATNEGTVATFTIKNQGSSTAPAGVSMRAFFSKDAVYGNEDDRILPTFKTTVELKPGRTTTISIESRATAQQPGDFRVGGFVDSRNIVGESNEKNNVRMTGAGMVRYYHDLEDHHVTATEGKDRISIWKANGRALVDVNGKLYGIQGVWLYKPVTIDALAGHDRMAATPDYPYKLIVNGGLGNDTIIGGASNDTLSGGNHSDRINGGLGNDAISGGNHGDFLFGDAGNDSISGGGGNDQLTGGLGSNLLSGGDGDDLFSCNGNGASDTLGGGNGNDTANTDAIDIVDHVEVNTP